MPRLITNPAVLLSALALALVGLLLVLLAPRLAPAGGFPDGPPADAPVVIFPDANAFVIVELARTEEERQRGLMGRSSLEEGTGMLFVFPETVRSPFWMKNTLIPLSIAFIDASGLIVDIQDMQPLDETLHFPAAPYRYALEVPQGWFVRTGIAVGQQVVLPAM